MTTVATQTRYTPEDLLKMPDGDRYELVDGQLVERPMSTWSSYVGGEISRRLGEYSRANKAGWVLPADTGYQCFPDAPNKVRRPDISFIRSDRMTVEQAKEEGYNSVAPDLAVEVLSPNEVAYDVDKKIQEYLKAGVRLVWVVNPQSRTIEVHRIGGQGTILRESDELEGEDVLPGFHTQVKELFSPPAGVT
jgi:Uma2 family endonuclease